MTLIEGRPPIVIDTNVWASRLITPDGVSGEAVRYALGQYHPVHSPETLYELTTRLERPKLAKYSTPEERRLFVSDVETTSTILHRTVGVKACPDPDDDIFLGLAMAAGARKIISGDSALLSMKQYHGIAIQSPALFLESERMLDEQLRLGTLRKDDARLSYNPYPWLNNKIGVA